VLAAASTESAEETLGRVAVLLAWLGRCWCCRRCGAYGLVGRSLRSVEAIRGMVARIETGDLSQRVPVPLRADEIARLATTMNEAGSGRSRPDRTTPIRR